ncbi:TerD family protein [Sphingomonas sp.]|uniref:TerD family protein n=1 Tax=Sphingomonas sp. TaxID=28214 RepID=UPI000DBC38FE|nr:TerD family protein [Sphingomonas sp.]PZT93987.1 MAG: hypothetical protein DI625_07485 [Sphingomonas sp.]
MPDLTMGANAPITEERGDLVLKWPAEAGSLDCSAFLLSAVGRVRSDDDMIFYNQREDADASVRLSSRNEGGNARFAFDLRRVPRDVDRVVVCVTVDGAGRTMEAFAGLEASFGRDPSAIRFRPDLRGAREAALRVVEFYRRGGGWKLRADGQGYNAGLGPLARSFGVDVEETEPVDPAPAPRPRAMPADDRHLGHSDEGTDGLERPMVFDVQPADVAVALRPVSRPAGAAVLERGATQELTLSNAIVQAPIRATLSWSSRQGGGEGRARPLRLRLGAFYEMRNGLRGALQEPDVQQAPSGDDLMKLVSTDGPGTDEQSIVVAPGRMSEIDLLHFYAVLDGPSTWRSSHVEFTVIVPGVAPVAMEVPKPDDGSSCVLIATLRIDGALATLRHLSQPAIDQQMLDTTMEWGVRWRYPGRT